MHLWYPSKQFIFKICTGFYKGCHKVGLKQQDMMISLLRRPEVQDQGWAVLSLEALGRSILSSASVFTQTCPLYAASLLMSFRHLPLDSGPTWTTPNPDDHIWKLGTQLHFQNLFSQESPIHRFPR